jgi:hypothetical protein
MYYIIAEWQHGNTVIGIEYTLEGAISRIKSISTNKEGITYRVAKIEGYVLNGDFVKS